MPKNTQALLTELGALLATLGPEALRLLLTLLRAIRTSKDPVEALKRATKATVAKEALRLGLSKVRAGRK